MLLFFLFWFHLLLFFLFYQERIYYSTTKEDLDFADTETDSKIDPASIHLICQKFIVVIYDIGKSAFSTILRGVLVKKWLQEARLPTKSSDGI